MVNIRQDQQTPDRQIYHTVGVPRCPGLFPGLPQNIISRHWKCVWFVQWTTNISYANMEFDAGSALQSVLLSKSSLVHAHLLTPNNTAHRGAIKIQSVAERAHTCVESSRSLIYQQPKPMFFEMGLIHRRRGTSNFISNVYRRIISAERFAYCWVLQSFCLYIFCIRDQLKSQVNMFIF